MDGGRRELDAGLDAADVEPLDAGEDVPPPPPPAPDAATDAGDPSCMPVRPPERPVLADGPSLPTRWYALRHIRIGNGTGWRELGYDLDGRCTTTESTDVECAPPPGFSPADDGPAGRDNTFGQTFVPLLTIVEADFEGLIDRYLELGHYGVLLRVAEWNGTPNDPVVDVALVDAIRGYAAGSDPAGAEPLVPPAWDGSDAWLGSSRSFVAGDLDRPLARDTAGYVVDGELVAKPRDGTEINITGEVTLTLKLTNAFVTARFSDGNRALDGVTVAGRMALDDIFNTLPRLDVCPGTERYDAISEAMRRAADVTTSGEATPFLMCEAISIGLGAEGVLATVEAIVPARTIPDYCDDIDNEICLETCPTSHDGVCDDGGTGSLRISCDIGTDCTDCGGSRPG